MGVTDVLGLLGGLALFLYGMQMMSSGLEAAAGNRMKQILERLTSNRFLGVAVGAAITAVIQSSSATTVMVVGFVNSGMMTLIQAVWIIMGANVGTTITGQLIALDVGALAPLFAFCGVALVVFTKKVKLHHWGLIVAGLGILFIGMDMMSAAMMPLRDSPAFVSLMTRFSNPALGILAGAVFTAAIQSSSASVGILQALAVSGVIGLPSAVYVLFGQNIGTCITAVLASIGTSRNAKRTTVIHLLFNVIGTTVFTVICILTPLTAFVQSLSPANPAAQIANMHTLFNLATTLMLLPFGTLLAKAAVRILPERPSEKSGGRQLLYIKPVEASLEYQMGTSAIIVNGVWRELRRMAEMVNENLEQGFQGVLEKSSRYTEAVAESEAYVNYLNTEISRYISHVITYELNEEDGILVSAFFKICGSLERIGDHAVNISEQARLLEQKQIAFSDEAQEEIQSLRQVSIGVLDSLSRLEAITEKRLAEIADYEQEMDDLTLEYQRNQMARMKKGCCSDEACVIYSEILMDIESIGDHILSIGEVLVQASSKGTAVDAGQEVYAR
ncbi:Na/Pi cotransporter family protein [Eubacterium sp. 1001713B170207_170306_E7]|uniref:Na/Pi cotransporter family protein n=1 Tax=Eubacterium sp. 1001713B170207_170306_E7 TaxID=2787097 RepID=UPI001898C333|nr:Na/Pi cotransporter family protein [Eubacterium sp. 1001713B170207_170306_E7]